MDDSTSLELLKEQLSVLLPKFDKMAESIQSIEKIMAKQEGQNIALRLHQVEDKVTSLRQESASNSWVPDQVKANTRFMYKLTGAFVVIQAAVALLIKFGDRLF